MKKVVVANNKGGVGKTTIASQLAFHLAGLGRSVVALDLDGQRNLTSVMRDQRVIGSAVNLIESGRAPAFTASPGDLLVIAGDADIPVSSEDEVLQNTAQAIAALEGADFCIIDTPPTFSAVVYGALLAADAMLVPIELKKFSLDGIEGVLKAFVQVKEINSALEFLGLMPSRFDAVKQSERETLREVAEHYAQLIIPHAIRNRVAYEAAEAEGLHVRDVPTRSGREAAAEFRSFVDWFLDTVIVKEAA